MTRHLVVVVVMAVSLAVSAPATAAPFPDSIPLPVDFAPEGIASGTGSTFYAGSLTTGDIYRGDLRSGAGGIFIDAPPGVSPSGSRLTTHITCCSSLAGHGAAYVYDTRSGAPVATYQFAPAGAALLNDVVVTSDGAYFTDSFTPVLYKIPIGRGGTLGPARRSRSAAPPRRSTRPRRTSTASRPPQWRDADRQPHRAW